MNWWQIGLLFLVGLGACVGLGMLMGYLYLKIWKRPRSQKPEKTIRDKPVRENTVGDNTIRDNTIRDNTVRENTIRDNPIRDNPVRDNPIRNNRQVNLAARRNEFRIRPIKCLATNPNNPEDGRIFLRTNVGWFERLDDPSGDLIFTEVSQSEEELLKFVAQDNPSAYLVPLDREHIKVVYDELREFLPLSDLKRYFVKGRESKNKLFTITGMVLLILGLLIFGMGIYFRFAYSPTNIQTVGTYKLQFEQVYYGGLAAIIVGAIMDIFGGMFLALASMGKG
jgi:hypothetical protein